MSIGYLVSRFAGFFVTIYFIVTLVFFALRIMPGDPAQLMLGEMATHQELTALREAMGLNQSIIAQYKNYFAKLLVLDLGESLSRKQEVTALISKYFLSSLKLSTGSLIVATSLAIGVVFLFLYFQIKGPVFFIFTAVFSSIPIFLLAPFGILILSISLKLLPVSGADSLSHYVLPCLSLGLVMFAPLARLIRATVLSESKKDYVRTARAKGLSETQVVWKHVFKNAWVPVFFMWTQLWGSILAGAVVTETLFDWPGIGKLFYSAFQSRDYPLIQGIVITVAVIYTTLQLVVDMVSAKIDKRIEFQK